MDKILLVTGASSGIGDLGKPSMNYQLLGRSGLRVSDLCLGTDYIDFTHPRSVEYMRAPKSKFLSVSVSNQEASATA